MPNAIHAGTTPRHSSAYDARRTTNDNRRGPLQHTTRTTLARRAKRTSACRWNDTRACGVNISGPAPTFGASMTTCPSLVLCADSGENCVAVSSLRRGGNDSKHSTDILGDGVGAICLCTCRIHSPLHSCSSWQNAINHRIAPHACIMSMTRKSVRTPTYAYLSACVLPLPLVLVCR